MPEVNSNSDEVASIGSENRDSVKVGNNSNKGSSSMESIVESYSPRNSEISENSEKWMRNMPKLKRAESDVS